MEIKRKKERKEVGTQLDLSPSPRKEKKNTWTQTSDSPERRRRSRDETIEEMEKRIKRLEEAREAAPRSTEGPTVSGPDSWSTVGRKETRKKKGSVSHLGEEEGSRQKKDADSKKIDEEEKRKGGNKSLRALKRKIQQGAGVLLELQRGSLEDYGRIINECQKKIKLEELGIPPIGIRKARRGGILMEIRMNDKEEEKARLLANKIKEVVSSVEGATVRCPLRRTRLKLVGLPFGVGASEIAGALARAGGGSVEGVRVGPLRTTGSGAGTTWADCPSKMAEQAAAAAHSRMGPSGSLPRKGGALVPSLPGAGAPQAVVSLRG